ncbi:hypothetical protein FOZ62_005173, partial [Perkinsus olseni]
YVEAPHVKSFLDNTEQQQGIRVPMSIGEERDDAGRKGGRCVVVDVVFNSEILTKATDAADGGEYKRSICQLALSGVGREYGMDSLDVDNFVTRRMRYKDSDASSFTGSIGGSSITVPVDDPLQPLRGSVCEIRVSLPGVLTASHIEVEASDECVRIRHNPPFSGHRKYRTLIIWFPTRFAGGVLKCEHDGEVLKVNG